MIKNQVRVIFSPIQMDFGSSNPPISQPHPDVTRPTSFDAVDIACRLDKLSTFLPAALELLSILSERNCITTRKVCIFVLFQGLLI